MRILQLITNASYGGHPLHVMTLSQGLVRLDNDVVLISMRGGPLVPVFERFEIPVKVIPFQSRLMKRNPVLPVQVLSRLRQTIRIAAPDIVHTHGPRAHFFGTLTAKSAGLISVSTIHGSLTQFTSGEFKEDGLIKQELKRLKYGLTDRLAARMGGHMIAVCNATKRELVHNLGIAEERITTIHNGIDEIDVDMNESVRLRRDLGFADDAFLFTYVGRITFQKGVSDLVNAAIKVATTSPSACFLLVGEGALAESLKKRVVAAGLSDRIVFAGTRPDAVSLMAASQAVVLPSLSEGLSLTLLEAAMMGRATITTNVGGNPEIVKDGITGILTRLRDPGALASAMNDLMENPEKRKNMGCAARELWKSEFTADRMVARTEALYQDLLQASGK